ncbi:hypothetical protein BC827DRAFT_1266256 [Russula dissimulans]|nr:hypothetical protein BC827DRAFT_1266256 [Russula dissimulans]
MAHGYEASSSFSGIPILDNNGDTKPQRKKLKKSSGGEQYICNTCCRTDSPEWRKVDLKTSPLFYVASSLVTIDEAKQVLSSHPVGLVEVTPGDCSSGNKSMTMVMVTPT